MSKEIKGTIYKLTYTATWHEFIECSSKTDLFEYVACLKLAGYGITSVVEICKDGKTPKVAIFSDKEYKAIYKRLEKEIDTLIQSENDASSDEKFVYVCYEENYHECADDAGAVNALTLKENSDGAVDFLREQVANGIDDGFIVDEESPFAFEHYNSPEEAINLELAKNEIDRTGKICITMFHSEQENWDRHYDIVVSLKEVE